MDQSTENNPDTHIIEEILDEPDFEQDSNSDVVSSYKMADPTESFNVQTPQTDIANNNDNQAQRQPQSKRIPKHILEGQRKHQEMIEKQQKAIKPKAAAKKVAVTPAAQPNSNVGMKRVFVGGTFKYVPVNANVPSTPPSNRLAPTTTASVTQVSRNVDSEPEPRAKPLPTLLSKKLEQYQAKLEKERENLSTRSNTSNNREKGQRRVPARFAKQMEDEVKKRTMQSVKTFSDLRRIKAMEDLDTSNIDTTRTTIIEMRKLKAEQRRREQSEAQKRIENNKFESAVQKIKNDEKLSQFAKTLKIKNLSVNSRHKKINVQTAQLE